MNIDQLIRLWESDKENESLALKIAIELRRLNRRSEISTYMFPSEMYSHGFITDYERACICTFGFVLKYGYHPFDSWTTRTRIEDMVKKGCKEALPYIKALLTTDCVDKIMVRELCNELDRA